MISGLECSEVLYSYIRKQNDIFRLDSFYYSKEFLKEEQIINDLACNVLGSLKNTSILSFGAYSLNNQVEYLDEGVPFVRCVDMKNGTIDTTGLIHISSNAHRLLYKSEIFPETVLVSMSGSIGNVALSLPDWEYPINSNQDIAKIKLNGDMNAYYVYSFFTSKYGQNFMRREARGSVQQHVFLSQIEQVKIPIFSEQFYILIEKIVKDGLKCDEIANKKYKDTEAFLLQSLNLDKDYDRALNYSVRSFSNINIINRLDSEYYQLKYDCIYNDIIKLPHITAYSVLSKNNKTFIPLDKEKYLYIELADIDNYGGIYDTCDIANGKELPSRARRKVSSGDIIVSSIEGSLSSCAVISDEYNNAVCSTGFYIMNSDDINSETLLLLFKSYPIQMLMKRGCSGTILTAISKDELKNVPIPIPSPEVQKHISMEMKNTFDLRKRSKHLILSAAKAVEIAIEQNEKEAVSFLESIN